MNMSVNTDLDKTIYGPVFALELLVITVGIAFGEATQTSLFYGELVVCTGLFLMCWCSGHVRPGRVEGGGISGPWRFMRHPEVLSRFLMVFGFLLIARAAWVFAISTLVLGWFYHRMVMIGDAELSRWMGPQFSVYRLFVPSILPQFLPVRLPQQGLRSGAHGVPWSFRKAWARRFQSLVPLLAVILLALTSIVVQAGLSWNWVRGLALLAFLVLCKADLVRSAKYIKTLNLNSVTYFRRSN